MEPRTELPVPPIPNVTLARIKAALEDVPVDRLVDVYEYLIALQEDAEDLAAIAAARSEYKRTGDRGVPLTNYLHERGELEEVETIARSERLISE